MRERDAFDTMFMVVSVGFVLLVIYMLATGIFVHNEPWMNTVVMPMQNKVIAAYGNKFVLAPKECVDASLSLVAGCEDKVIFLPILP